MFAPILTRIVLDREKWHISMMTLDPHGAGRLRECHVCGLVQSLPELPRGAVARCAQCRAVLRRRRTDPHGRALAMAVTGLMLFGLATQMPFMELRIGTNAVGAGLATGPEALNAVGAWPMAAAVLVTTIGAPLIKMLATIWVLIGIRRHPPAPHLARVFAWVERLSPWSMVEVFLLGVFVAYTKLIDMAQVEIGGALYALGALMLTMAATDAVMDDAAVWDRLGHPAPAPPGRVIACLCCDLVVAASETHCPRCGSGLHHRRPGSIGQSWALLIAATLLYIPANLLPVLNLASFGRVQSSTILAGVMELAASGMWPLAALVFIASVMVPVLKVFGMGILLISTQLGAAGYLRERSAIYRVVESIGRWSMIDVFMISILTALVHLDRLATITPGPGAVCFCGVVVLTMLAAMRFDPRLMWDAARRLPA